MWFVFELKMIDKYIFRRILFLAVLIGWLVKVELNLII